jgi:putative hydrolase of the HAD superfamily
MDIRDYQTVLLDLDGTLLDLSFDDQFWTERVVSAYAAEQAIDFDEAFAYVLRLMTAQAGQLSWYDFDHWQRALAIDLESLQSQSADRVRTRPGTIEFLEYLQRTGAHVILATNAHPKVLDFKFEALQRQAPKFVDYFDEIISSHAIGFPKESVSFWQEMHRKIAFDPGLSVLIDDNLAVLAQARLFGVKGLIGITQPNLDLPPRTVDGFAAVQFLDTLVEA